MTRLYWIRILCVLIFIISCIALYMEINKYNIRSMALIYLWAALAITGLVGNAVSAVIFFIVASKKKKSDSSQ